jgi:hypothetical protein
VRCACCQILHRCAAPAGASGRDRGKARLRPEPGRPDPRWARRARAGETRAGVAGSGAGEAGAVGAHPARGRGSRCAAPARASGARPG